MGTAIVKKSDKYNSLVGMLEGDRGYEAIQKALPNHLTPERMIRVALTAIGQTPKLLDCEPVSVVRSVIESASLGLMCDGILGQAYLVPFKNKCTLIIGYKGLIDLARRSGEVASIEAHVVYKGDDFDFAFGMDRKLAHVPAQMVGREPGDPFAVYAVVRFKSGEIYFDVMFRDEVEKIRKAAPGGNSDAWVNHWNEMARKTVLRRVCKYLPMSTEYMDRAIAIDEMQEAGHMEVLDTFGGEYVDEDGVVDVTPKKEDKGKLDQLTQELNAPQATADDVPDPEPPWDLTPPPEEEPTTSQLAQKAANETLKAMKNAQKTKSRKGRITQEEDNEFEEEVQSILSAMEEVQSGELVKKFFYRAVGAHGAESHTEIRKRPEREAFLKDMRDMLDQWESVVPK